MTITTVTVMVTEVMVTKVMMTETMVFYCDAQKIVNWLGGQTTAEKSAFPCSKRISSHYSKSLQSIVSHLKSESWYHNPRVKSMKKTRTISAEMRKHFPLPVAAR